MLICPILIQNYLLFLKTTYEFKKYLSCIREYSYSEKKTFDNIFLNIH